MASNMEDFDFSSLSDIERVFLAGRLLDSVHEHSQSISFTAEQLTELKRRMAVVDAGTMKRVPWDVAYQRLMRQP